MSNFFSCIRITNFHEDIEIPIIKGSNSAEWPINLKNQVAFIIKTLWLILSEN